MHSPRPKRLPEVGLGKLKAWGGMPAMELHLEPNWEHLTIGETINFVGKAEVVSPQRQTSLIRTALAGRCLMINQAVECSGTMAILQATVTEVQPGIKVDVRKATIIRHRPADDEAWLRVTETCAAIGAMMEGFKANGVSHEVGNEIRSTFTDLQRRRGHTMVEGDIGDYKVMMALAEHAA